MAGSIWAWVRTAADNDDADGDINWAEGQLPHTVNNSARQMMGRVAEFLDDLGGDQTTGGSANAQTLTARSAFTALATGLVVGFKAGFSNTGAATLDVNSLGAKGIRRFSSGGELALVANDIRVTGKYLAVYDSSADGGSGGWILLNPSALTAGAATILREWNVSDTDIDGLVEGSNFGTVLEGAEAGHVMIGVRGNDTGDKFCVIGRATGSTYTTLLFDVSVAGTFSVMSFPLADSDGGRQLRSRTVSQLSSLTPTAGRLFYCSNASGGAEPVFGDGAAWRRVSSRVELP